MTRIFKLLGPSFSHVALALAVQSAFFFALSPFIGFKGAVVAGASFATGAYLMREIEQVYPHFPRFGLAPLPQNKQPTATDWMRAARQSFWPSGVVITIAALYCIYL